MNLSIVSCNPRCRRVTSRTAGYDCENNATVSELEGGDPRTDHSKKGTTRTRAGIPKRLRPIAQMPRGGHPSCDTAPLTTSLRGLWVSGSAGTGQWWNVRRGGDPKADQVTQGADSELPGWQPKETASFSATDKRNSRNSVGGISAPNGRRAKNPGVAAPLASASCRGNCW